jgi:hypothetical protein
MTDDENISRLYQRGKQHPPAHLDDKILNAAHDAVGVPNTVLNDKAQVNDTAKSPFSGGWPATVSIAAVLIITVILVPLINNESDSPVVQSSGKSLDESLKKSVEESLVQSPVILNRVDEGSVVMERRVAMQQQKSRSESVQTSKQAVKAVTKAPSFKSDMQHKKSLRPLSGVNDVAGAGVWSGVLPRRAPVRMEAATEAESLPAPLRKARLVENKNQFERDEVAPMAMSLADKQEDGKIAAYGEKPGVMQPKKWLEKISHLLDASDFEQAEIEVEEFRRCYPDEVIGESLLNRLSVR